MNPEDLRFFLAIRDAKSIKGAARRLKVDHSTVSRRLAALEDALGAPLFERTSEGLLETEVAHAISPLAENIELMARELVDAARAASSTPAGPVRIAVSPHFADQVLIPRVTELMRRFPDVELDIRADVARASVVRREADIAVRTGPANRNPAESAALALKVATVGFAAYASLDYVERHGQPERPVRSLAGHRMIRTGTWGGPGDPWNDQLDHPADYALTVYPFASVTVAVLAGLGIGVLPCIGSDSDPRLVRLSDVVASFDMWVVTPPEARNNLRIQGVKAWLIEEIHTARAALAGES
jgi:DNA-binding transcriptional LysR family regulator